MPFHLDYALSFCEYSDDLKKPLNIFFENFKLNNDLKYKLFYCNFKIK